MLLPLNCKIACGIDTPYFPSCKRTWSQVTKEIKFSAVPSQILSSGAYMSWYTEDPSLEERSNGVITVNGLMIGMRTRLSDSAGTAVARSSSTVASATFVIAALFMFLSNLALAKVRSSRWYKILLLRKGSVL